MTLTELRYIVALSNELHFGRAAHRCHVTQPTLSLAVQKLEGELGIALFERSKNEVLLTPKGEAVVMQARRVLEEADKVPQIAKGQASELEGPIKLGIIPTIAPYLLPELIAALKQRAPLMTLDIEESYTSSLTPMLRDGNLDCVIVALPFASPGVVCRPLYDEHMLAIAPADHAWARQSEIRASQLNEENLLLLDVGNCFRDQVMEVCPGQLNTAQPQRAGASLETIRNMVASGLGVSIMPEGAVQKNHQTKLVAVMPIQSPAPSRRVAIAWRVTFARPRAIDALIESITAVKRDWLRPLS